MCTSQDAQYEAFATADKDNVYNYIAKQSEERICVCLYLCMHICTFEVANMRRLHLQTISIFRILCTTTSPKKVRNVRVYACTHAYMYASVKRPDVRHLRQAAVRLKRLRVGVLLRPGICVRNLYILC
jgi:hypothetical protein